MADSCGGDLLPLEQDLTSAIHHDGSEIYVSSQEPSPGDHLVITLRVPKGFRPDHAYLRTCPDGEQAMTSMIKARETERSIYYQAPLKVTERRMTYRFLLVKDGKALWYNNEGVTWCSTVDDRDFKVITGSSSPGWLEGSVFYQIFPDRFNRGKHPGSIGAYEYDGHSRKLLPWGAAPLHHSQGGNVDFFGGTLRGIEEKLDYLSGLGVNALYLTPVFTSLSNHKYDIIDFFNVDPGFGGNRALARLTKAVRERDMRIILDVTLNHCGVRHGWFQKACADSSSKEAGYFTFHSHPDSYEMWLGVRTLPKLNYRSQALRDVMYRKSRSVLRRWLRPPWSIDGWRLDVANMIARQGMTQLAHEVGREIRAAVKGENSEAYLLGEHFFDGSPHLQGDELDAAMNYHGFTFPAWRWMTDLKPWWIKTGSDAIWDRIPAEALAGSWMEYLSAIPWASAKRQFNLLDTHDTPRIVSTLKNDMAMTKLAALLLFTFPGVPSIFYGDETGLSGDGDPWCRQCMIWQHERWNHELMAHYKALIGLRRSSPALRRGGFEVLKAEGGLLAFMRECRDERLIIVLNRDGESAEGVELEAGLHGIEDNRSFADVFSHSTFKVEDGILRTGTLSDRGFLLLRQQGAGPRA